MEQPPILRLRPFGSAHHRQGPAHRGAASHRLLPQWLRPPALSYCGAPEHSSAPAARPGGLRVPALDSGSPPGTPSAPWVSCLQTRGCITGILDGEILRKHSHGSVFTRPAPRFPPAPRRGKPPPGQTQCGGVSVRGKESGKGRDQESRGVFMRLLGPGT